MKSTCKNGQSKKESESLILKIDGVVTNKRN